MHRHSHSSERGQAVVIIVVAMVVLLGFTALAVDGSMVYADRRHAQSAADSSSLAGGTYLAQELEKNNITNLDMYSITSACANVPHMVNITTASRQAAKTRAGDNDFPDYTTNTTALGESGSGAITACGKEDVTARLASGGEAVIFEEYYIDLTSQISGETDTAFAHFVFSDNMANTVSAVTRIFPRQPLAYGYAIVALNDRISNCNSNQDGLMFGGSAGTGVLDGGIFSNGCLDVDGSAGDTSIVSSEYSGKKKLGAYYFGTANNYSLDKIKFGVADHADYLADGSYTPISGAPLKLADDPRYRIPLSSYDIPMPDCSGHEVNSNWVTNYWKNHGTHIPSGLYCITDELRIGAQDIVRADKVTFVLLKGMTINANAQEVDLRMRYPSDPETGAIAGLLIYQPRNITADITVNGTSNSTFRGSWIAPGASLKFDGNAAYKVFGQVVGWNVDIRGSAIITVEYRQKKLVSRPAHLELHR